MSQLEKRTAAFFAHAWEKGYIAGTAHGIRLAQKKRKHMTKKNTETWPLRVWCVCYRASDYPGGWVPYSGSMYYYKDEAVTESASKPGSKVKAFYIGPKRTVNGSVRTGEE